MDRIKKVVSVWALTLCVMPLAAQYPVIPDSVKTRGAQQEAETNRKSKSLKFYHERFRPPASVRISMADYKRDEWVLNLPLWAVEYLEKEIRLHTTVPT